jgi:nucleotide-binding universal stress UspA family protein
MIKLSRILVPSDFSDLSIHSMLYVKSFAAAYRAEVHVLHVVDEAYQYWMALGPNSLPIGPPPEELVSGSRSELNRFVETHLHDVSGAVVKEVVLGRPFLEIIRYARHKSIDLIIMGTHGRSGLTQALLGSVAEKVVRKAPCPVLTIRHPQHEFVMP